MVRKENVVIKEGLKGGNGTVEIHHFLTEEELMGHATMYARVVLKPHSSIGWHQHIGNTEPYAIIKGEGTFVDNDGSKTTVHPGDVCLIEVGQWHAMENNTDEDMEMIALIMIQRFPAYFIYLYFIKFFEMRFLFHTSLGTNSTMTTSGGFQMRGRLFLQSPRLTTIVVFSS